MLPLTLQKQPMNVLVLSVRLFFDIQSSTIVVTPRQINHHMTARFLLKEMFTANLVFVQQWKGYFLEPVQAQVLKSGNRNINRSWGVPMICAKK